MILPDEIQGPEKIDPGLLTLYSAPKGGKTTALAALPNSIILDTEEGTSYVSARKVHIRTLKDLGEFIVALREANKTLGKPKYDFIVIDTFTRLYDYFDEAIINKYKETPQGKTYTGRAQDIPFGGMNTYGRLVWWDIYEALKPLAPHLILTGHIKESQIPSAETGGNELTMDIPGKLEPIIRSATDAICYLKRKENKSLACFMPGAAGVVSGSRAAHLANREIVLSELIDGKVVTHWNDIYVDYFKKHA